MISFGEVFPDEIQLKVLGELIHSRNFPSSLVRFSQVNKQELNVARDNHLWNAAIGLYFPFINDASISKEIDISDNLKANRWQLFKLLYERCCYVLKSEQLSFEDYIKAVQNEWGEIPVVKHRVLIGLLVAAGHSRIFNNVYWAQGKNHALLFSAALGNRTVFAQRMVDPVAPSPAFKRRSLVVAAQYGHLTLCSYLLTHAHADLDRESLKDAFLNACALGHLQLVQIFLAPPRIQMLNLYLAKGLSLACMQGYTAIVIELLKNVTLKRNEGALKEAVTCAIRFFELRTLEVLLQDTPIAKNHLFMIELLTSSVERENVQVTALVLKHAKVTFSLVCILNAIEVAINNADDQTVLALLTCNVKIPAYAKRNIFYNAAQRGHCVLIEYFLKTEPMTFSSQHISQALRLAASNNHLALLLLLIQTQGDKLSISDRAFLMAMPCYYSSQVLRSLVDLTQICDLTMQLEKVALEDVNIPEQTDRTCLAQYNYASKALRGDRTNSSSSHMKKRL